MSFQIPKPTNIPGQGNRPGPPGKNFRPPGINSGARPGPPKPKNPALINGKPMVPIQNLIQFTPKFDPENETQSPNNLNVQKSESQEANANVESSDIIKEPIIQDVQFEPKSGNKVENIEDGAQSNEKIVLGNGIESSDPEMEGLGKARNQVASLNLEPKKVERKSQELLSIPKEETANDEVTEIQLNGKLDQNRENQVPEIDPEGPLRGEESGLRKEIFDIGVNEEQQKPSTIESGLLAQTQLNESNTENVKKSPFGVLKTPELKTSSPFPNLAKAKIEKDDEDQNQSPATRETKATEEYQEGRSTQDEQREYGINDDPSSGLSNETKRKDYLEEEISDNLGSTKKGYHFQREEETTLLNQLKALRVELEKEQQEKALIKAENERMLRENIELKNKLDFANKKCEGLEKRETGSRDLARKDEEIKRLKSELRSTMEGSRLLTEHTNRVISESTKFKEDTEILIAKLEREKDELHQRFLEYKKESQQDYIAKFAALQEKIAYLQNKIQEYEAEMERSQVDLRQKISRIHKLAQINDDVQSTISYWPTFTPKIIVQTQVESKQVVEEEVHNRDQELVMVEESPAMHPLNEEVIAMTAKAEEFEVDLGVRTEVEKVEQEEQEQEQEQEMNVEVQQDNAWNVEVPLETQELVQENVEINEGGWGEQNIQIDQGGWGEQNVQIEQGGWGEQQDVQIEQGGWGEQQDFQIEQGGWGDQELQIEQGVQEEEQRQEVQENNEIGFVVDDNPWGSEQPLIAVTENYQVEEEVSRQEEIQEVEQPVFETRVQEDPEQGVYVESAQAQEQRYEEEAPVQVETRQEEKIEEMPVPFFPGKANVVENNLTINAMSAPPSNRLLQKKKKGQAVQKHVPWMPTVAQTVEEPSSQVVEEPVQNGSESHQQQEEEVQVKPPVQKFMGAPGFKKPSVPQFNKPFINRPPINGKQAEENHALNMAQEEQAIAVDYENNHEQKGNEVPSSLEQTENSSTRKMSGETKSQEDLDANENQNKPVMNGPPHGKPVKISKAIKRKEPITGSIYS